MANSMKSAIATMGAGTALEAPAMNVSGRGASRSQGAKAAATGTIQTALNIASLAGKAKGVVDTDTGKARSALATMGAGAALEAPSMTLTAKSGAYADEAKASVDGGTQTTLNAASTPKKALAQTVAGYGEMDRLDITITDALVLDVTLSDALILDVTVS